MRSTYSARVVTPSSLLVEAKDEMSSSVLRLSASAIRPSLSARPNSVQKVEYFSGSFALHVLDGREDLLGQTTTDGSDLPVLLQNFTRDVEREVLCVDDTLDEAQVIGHQLFTVVHDEDALDVEVDAGLALTHEEIERRRRRNEQQRLVFESTFGLHRDDPREARPRRG